MIKYIGIGIAGLALVGCAQAAPAPAPTVTVTAAPTVAPTVAPPAPVPTSNFYQDSLTEAWNSMSSTDQEGMCFAYNTWPADAWDAFNQGAEGLVPRNEFDQFFSMKCSAY